MASEDTPEKKAMKAETAPDPDEDDLDDLDGVLLSRDKTYGRQVLTKL